MVKTLQSLVIVLVAVGPVFDGLRLALGDTFATASIAAAERAPFDGRREDDAGPLTEECEEDDNEQEESRVLLVGSAFAVPSDDATPRGLIQVAAGARNAADFDRLHLSRGPPARR